MAQYQTTNEVKAMVIHAIICHQDGTCNNVLRRFCFRVHHWVGENEAAN